ncbi:NLR family CARD domain-containing protein 3-like [Pholidichthys leucotaenia]
MSNSSRNGRSEKDSTDTTPGPSCAPSASDKSVEREIDFAEGLPTDTELEKLPTPQFPQGFQAQLDSIFTDLEENIVTFVKNGLKKMKKNLNPDSQECSDSQREDEEAEGDDEEMRSSRDLLLKIILNFLRRMEHKKLADYLQMQNEDCEQRLKSNLKEKFQSVFEGIAKDRRKIPLNKIYTELYITEGDTTDVNDQHEIRQIETASRKPYTPHTTIRCKDIFTPLPGRDRPIKTLLTKGVAGIGKTVLTQKFSLDWAEGKTNQDIRFIFPFTFRELNMLKEKFSLVRLVHHFFPETKEAKMCRFEDFKVVFIFDGLDECRLSLDFHNNEIVTDVTESTSVNVLLMNLIRRKLLPSAHLWITTRPAAANLIPPDYVEMVTEVRGFTDLQKEEYFKKRSRDKKQARKIISHVQTSRSLHIMCHIPIFCWITATVLEEVLKTREGKTLPKTLTEMYIHFVVVQIKLKNVKFDGRAETDPPWSPESKKMIEALGKLAFEHLLKGNLYFYESDLKECGIDIKEASVYSGMFTQIFKEEKGLYKGKVFCFIHLTVQEFLAALHLHLTFINSGVNLLKEEQTASITHLYQSAVDKALESPNGHLDLFLRFLVGLSLQTNQTLLQGLLTLRETISQTNQNTIEYIKKKIMDDLCPEKHINLFHCLNELNDHSIVKEIQHYLSSGNLPVDELSSAQWSALVFILLSSKEDLDEFDLKKYSASEKVLLKLMPVVKASKKAQLSGCNLSDRSCKELALIISSQSCTLRELDLSNNNLQDSGLQSLCAGLKSPNCLLESLRLSGCLITEEGCASLVGALMSNPTHLKELDLSYNHPGDTGIRNLCVKLASLRTEPCGVQWLKPNLKKYFCDLTPDLNTVQRNLKLSENNRRITYTGEDQPYADHPDRFDHSPQLLCSNSLTGRCYWEVEWRGEVRIAVTHKRIKRKGKGDDSHFGRTGQSWSLYLDDNNTDCFATHNKSSSSLPYPSCHRVAVYVDYPAGILSFYSVLPDTLVHIHTFSTVFTAPIYAGFRVRLPHSTVLICDSQI